MGRGSYFGMTVFGLLAGSVPVSCSSGAQIQAQNAVCAQLDNLTLEQMDAIFEQTATHLSAVGVQVDATIWSDPGRFLEFAEAVADIAGCPGAAINSLGVLELALQTQSDDYCGPGHGPWLPSVDGCLNEACRSHDACYSQCSVDISLSCTWSSATRPCDEVFIGAAHTCPLTANRFRSRMVIWLADRFYQSAALDQCGGGAFCPTPPSLGFGPCGAPQQGDACSECLDETDPGRVCLNGKCGGELGDVVCYGANCNVAACYGGWWGGVAGAGGGGGGGIGGTGGVGGGGTSGTGGLGGSGGIAPTSLWDLVLVSGELPATNLGATWDVGSAPDPIVTVRVGSATSVGFSSSEASDTYSPQWNEIVAPAVTAGQLMTYLEFEVIDADLAFEDFVGACSWTVPESAFLQSSLSFPCSADASQAGFDLIFYMSPH